MTEPRAMDERCAMLKATAEAVAIGDPESWWWTEGEWVYGADGDGVASCFPSLADGAEAFERARFIAEADPETILALLTERASLIAVAEAARIYHAAAQTWIEVDDDEAGEEVDAAFHAYDTAEIALRATMGRISE